MDESQRIIIEAFEAAQNALIEGKTIDEVVGLLRAYGFSESDAVLISKNANEKKVEYFKNVGWTRLKWGFPILLIGVFIFFAFLYATNGHQTLIFYGPLAFGGIYTLFGLIQIKTGWRL